MTTLDELEKLAKAATPGQWRSDGGMDIYVFTKDMGCMIAEMRGTGGGLSDEQQANNARHIAAANPATILAILEDYGAMKAALEHYSIIADRDGALGRDRREVARQTLEGLGVK